MKKRLLRLTAVFMFACMVVSSVPGSVVQAEEAGSSAGTQTEDTVDSGNAEGTDQTTDQGNSGSDQNIAGGTQEGTGSVTEGDSETDKETPEESEDASSADETEADEEAVPDDSTSSDSETDQETEEKENNDQAVSDSVIEKNANEINYVFVESPYLASPGTERIVVSYGDGTEEIEQVSLTVEASDGEREVWESALSANDLYLFEKDFSDESISDTYEVISLNVTDASGMSKIKLSDYEMEALFGVNEEYDGIEELQPLAEDTETQAQSRSVEEASGVEATVAEIDPEDPEASTEAIVDALEEAETDVETDGKVSTAEDAKASGRTASQNTAVMTGSIAALGAQIQTLANSSTRSGDVVVALDPGHDSKHTGATGIGGLKEEVLTLKIANYCKEELEKYSGVQVYMTRTSASCPYPNNSSSGGDIGDRVLAAVDAGADIFVSIHLNSSTSSSPNGAEVIVPNNNWKPDVAKEGRELAQAILDELKAVGVNMRPNEIYSKDTTVNEKYPDGSKSDYFSVQIYAKEAGIPGIIVEHAFLSNSNDVNKFLKTESGLKKLGVADATGIAEYLGLSKDGWNSPALKEATASADGTKISWNAVEGATGYAVYRRTSGTDWKMFATTTSTSYTDSSARTNGTQYYYTVRAYRGTWEQAEANKYKSAYWSSYDDSGVKAVYTSTPVLKGTSTASGGIKVSWNSVSGASGYAVYRKTAGGGWGMIDTTTSTSYTDKSGMSNGKTYYYTVRAYRGSVNTAKGNKYSAQYWSGYNNDGVQGNYIAIPELKQISTSTSGTTVSWNGVSGASGYAVYRKAAGGGWGMIDTTTSTSYTDKAALTSGVTYYYTVRAYQGNVDTAKNNRYSAAYWSHYNTTGLGSARIYTPELKSAGTVLGGIKVSWKAVEGASGYAVYRKTATTGWGMIDTTTSTSYTDKDGMKNGAVYYYTVRAYKGNVNTAKAHKYSAQYWSGYDTAGVKGGYITIPGLKKITASASGTTVSWNSVSGASGYAVYRKIAGSDWGMIDTTTSTSYTDKSSLANGKTYYYTVRAYEGDVNSAKANKYESAYWSYFNATGLKSVYTNIPVLKGTSIDSSAVKVSWGAVSGVSGYAVYRKTAGADWGMIGTTTSTSYSDKSAKTAGTTYYYTVRAYRGSEGTAKANKYSAAYWSGYNSEGVKAEFLSTPSLKKDTKVVNTGVEVSWNAVEGASGYAVYRKTASTGWGMIDTTTSTSYVDQNAGSSGTTYYYTVRAYRGDVNTAKAHKYSAAYWSYYDTSGVSGSAYAIEGKSSVTVDQMVKLYNTYSPIAYPSEALSKGGAATIKDFAQIFYEEAVAEGIKPEVVWCQTMVETGYLKFGGDVKISQYNFAGLGATGGGAAGATFKDVREGVRAQVQHMKAYASSTITESGLKYDLVDPRFQYVSKGAAKYVEILGAKENPLGIGWATGAGYGSKILNLIDKL